MDRKDVICVVLACLITLGLAFARFFLTPDESPEPELTVAITPEPTVAPTPTPAPTTKPAPEPTPSPEPEPTITTAAPTYCGYTEQDVVAMAQMLWGEARGCELDDKQNCCRTVCNRVDDPRWPSTPYEVVTQRSQYYGYSPSNPVDPELRAIAVQILDDWVAFRNGGSVIWYSYNCFSGDGVRNHFYTI